MAQDSNNPPPRYHDLGGLMAGAIEKAERDLEPWEKRVDVLRNLLGDKARQVLTTDELRNAIENLGESAYKDNSYYERWMAALMNILKEKGVVTQDEIDQRMVEVRNRLGLEDS
jgi:hypothetical protein